MIKNVNNNNIYTNKKEPYKPDVNINKNEDIFKKCFENQIEKNRNNDLLNFFWTNIPNKIYLKKLGNSQILVEKVDIENKGNYFYCFYFIINIRIKIKI